MVPNQWFFTWPRGLLTKVVFFVVPQAYFLCVLLAKQPGSVLFVLQRKNAGMGAAVCVIFHF